MKNQNNQAILDVLYDKNHNCPVCDTHFTSKAIRSRKNTIVSTDSDLYSHFTVVNPIIYDVIVCNHCGYAALENNFSNLRPTQIEWLKKEIKAKYTPTLYPEILNEKQAINRYKLALLSAMVKKSRVGERAYLCLKIGWLYRDLEDEANETLYLNHAKRDFMTAFSTEPFPIFELNEMTTMYIIAELSRRSGEFEQALRWIGDLIIRRDLPAPLRQRAEDLRNTVRDKMKDTPALTS